MKRGPNFPSMAIVAIVAAVILLAVVAGIERSALARRAVLGGDFVDMKKIQAQIDKGKLSNKEAEFYRSLEVELGY